jgi:hypothetical protein
MTSGTKMTIILSTKRDNLAILAADRLKGSQGGTDGTCDKTYSHPTLPLAFAVGGCLWWPLASNHASAREHIIELAQRITSFHGLVVKDLADRIRRLVEPGMEHMKQKTQVYIALVKDGKADVGLQQVSVSTMTDDPTNFWETCEQLMPPSIRPFFERERMADLLHDPSVTAPEAVGQRARTLIQRCIDYERTMNPSGRNEVIGAGIDVVLVTEAGASFLPST